MGRPLAVLSLCGLVALAVGEGVSYDEETGSVTVRLHKAKTGTGMEGKLRHMDFDDMGLSERALNLLANVESMQYVGPLHINNREVKCIYDTGSSNTWAYAKQCHSEACQRHQLVDPGQHEVTTETKVEYGSGDVTGYQVDGTVSFGECSECTPSCACGKHVDYIAIHSVKGQAFVYGEFNCIVGLAMPKLALGTSKMTVQSLMEQGLPQKKFSFYLTKSANRAGSRFTFGPPDNKLFKGEMKTHSLWNANEGALSYWTVKMSKIYLRHKDGRENPIEELKGYCSNGCQAAMDTGTSLITGPPDRMGQIIKMVDVKEDCTNVQMLPDIGFMLENPQTTYWLSAASYVMEDVDPYHPNSGSICMSSFQPLEMHGFTDFWIMGDTFLSSYYSVYDFSCYDGSGQCSVSLAAKSAQILLEENAKATRVQNMVSNLAQNNPALMAAHAMMAQHADSSHPEVKHADKYVAEVPTADPFHEHLDNDNKKGALIPQL